MELIEGDDLVLISLVPIVTGSGHNMRIYSLARALRLIDPNLELEVYLGSLQTIFTPMFEEIGVRVIDMSPKQTVDHSKHSHLSDFLNWKTMLEDYLSPTFYNSQRILRLTRLFLESRPDVVVADYDFSALAAADIARIPSVLITERYNFTITGITDDELTNAGFEVHTDELKDVRVVLNQLFEKLASSTAYVLTDKPFVEQIDRDTLAEELMESGKMKFVGPMIRPIDKEFNNYAVRESFGIKESEFLVVATMGGTSMFRENMLAMQEAYIQTFESLKRQIPNARMILIARENVEVPDGIICLTYVPNWIPLLRAANVLLAHPGWITVTEVSALGVPTVFLLSSAKEYHELEAYRRLELLGYRIQMGRDVNGLTEHILQLHDPSEKDKLLIAYRKVAPDANGALRAAELIVQAAETGITGRPEIVSTP